MPNNKKDFSDKDFRCKRCNAHLATEKLDRQVLVVAGSLLAIFNFASIACLRCESINVWQSPNLNRAENENPLCQYPDKVTDSAKPNKRVIKRLMDVRQVT
jgi:hypothetical protein